MYENTKGLLRRVFPILQLFGAESRIFYPSDLLLPNLVTGDDHPAVQELGELVLWSEGQV
ncbi:hypothetical protein [Microbulbifer epialgicus]|uniref:Uncharacterized protein n=1 Tax=Microbulbifer epialgicus TaxID=393907 RepID=A0ABV4P5S6_9GAMM